MYQVDAFAKNVFEGNPAAVIPLDSWISDKAMQSFAQENNLSETAFFCPTKTGYKIRWFTPNGEVILCGHATLATAYVIFNFFENNSNSIAFESKSGILNVSQDNDLYTLDFPSQLPLECEIPEYLEEGLGVKIENCYINEDYIVVFDNEKKISNLVPDMKKLSNLDSRGVIVTATSNEFDFVSRAFFPKYGIPEDPVTGSAHTKLIPLWSKKLNKTELRAKQISKRGGELFCKYNGDRVKIAGYAQLYMVGEINISNATIT